MYKSEDSEFSDKLSIVYHYYCALNEEDLEEFSQDQLIAFAKARDQFNPFKLNGLNLSIHQKLAQRSANNLQKFINRFPNFKLDLKRFENSFHKGEHEKQFKATPQQNNFGVSNIESYEDIVGSDNQTSREKGAIQKTGQSGKVSQSKATPQNKPQEFDIKSTQMKDEQSETKNNQERVEVEEEQQPRQQQEENKTVKKKVDWNQTSSEQDSFDEQDEDQQQKQAYLKDNKPVDDSIDSFEDNQQHNSQSLGKQSDGVQANKTETNQQTSSLTMNQQTQEEQLKHKINSVISGYSSNEVKHHYRYPDQMHQNQNNKTTQYHHSSQEENTASKKPAQNPKQQQDNSSEKQQNTSFLEEEENSSEASYDIDDQNLKLTQQNPPSHVPSHGKDQFQEEDEDDVDFQEKLKKVKQMHKINFQTHKKTYQTLRNQWNHPKHPNPGQNQDGSDSESLSDSDSFQEKQKRLASRQLR